LQEQQFNRRRAAAMNIRMAMSQSSTSVPAQATAGGSKEEMSPGSISPAQGMGGMGSPHHAGIGMKPGTQKPPAAVLQVVKQVITLNHIERFTTL
jgi:E1A/CREB-binding protein